MFICRLSRKAAPERRHPSVSIYRAPHPGSRKLRTAQKRAHRIAWSSRDEKGDLKQPEAGDQFCADILKWTGDRARPAARIEGPGACEILPIPKVLAGGGALNDFCRSGSGGTRSPWKDIQTRGINVAARPNVSRSGKEEQMHRATESKYTGAGFSHLIVTDRWVAGDYIG